MFHETTKKIAVAIAGFILGSVVVMLMTLFLTYALFRG
jgi:hypothetical protein